MPAGRPARPGLCGICKSKDRDKIETALVAGLSLRQIAGQWNFTRLTVRLHRDKHLRLSPKVKKAIEKVRENAALTVADKLERLWGDVQYGLEASRSDPANLKHLAPLINQGHRNAELQGRVDGTLTPEHTGGGPTVVMNFPSMQSSHNAPEVYIPGLDKKRSMGSGYAPKPVAQLVAPPDDDPPPAA